MTEVMVTTARGTVVKTAEPGEVLCNVVATYGNRIEEYRVKLNENGKVVFGNSREIPHPVSPGPAKGKYPIVDSSPG